MKRSRLFPIQCVHVLGSSVAEHNRRIVGGDGVPLSVKANGDKILEVNNPLRLMVAETDPD
jgi:hypothetical protein